MARAEWWTLAALLAAGCGGGEAGSAAEAVLTPEGWGPLRIGMTLDEVVAAAGPDSDPEEVGGPDPESCDMFRPARAPEGMLVMIEEGRLTRISLWDARDLATSDGLRIGATAAEVKARLGAAARSGRHEYLDPPAEYIDHWTAGTIAAPYVEDGAARGIRYEVGHDGRVDAIHVGGPSIQYVEGCA